MPQDLGVFAGLLAVLLVISFLAARWRTPTDPNRLEEWGVAGRAFGNWVTWFLIGGSSFTAYTLHRWALMLGLLGGLGSSVWLLYITPQYSLTGTLVKAHFGGSTGSLQQFGLDTKISVYIGLITLVLNLATVVVVTAALKLFRVSPNVDLTRPEDYDADDDRDGLDRLDFLLDGTPQRVGAHSHR